MIPSPEAEKQVQQDLRFRPPPSLSKSSLPGGPQGLPVAYAPVAALTRLIYSRNTAAIAIIISVAAMWLAYFLPTLHTQLTVSRKSSRRISMASA